MAVYLGNTFIGSAYIGNTPIVSAEMQQQKFLQFRNDPYSASLVLAIPYSTFPSLGVTNYYQDVSATIKGSGTNYSLVPTGSGILYSSGSVVSSGSYDWSVDGYTTSAAMSGSKNAGVISTASANFGTNSFVIETWVKFTGDIFPVIGPPFNQFIFGEISGDYLLADYSGGAGGWRFVSATGTGGWNITGTQTYTKNVWYNVVYVRSVGATTSTESIYLNGNRIVTVTGAIKSMGGAPQGFWSLFGTAVGDNDAGAHQMQDFRLYIGTDKGYSGTTITIPQSIVTIA